MIQNHHWCRTQSLDHHWQTVHDGDWTLVDENGEHIARIFDLGDASLLGSWRWRVWLDHRIREGSASTGTEARQTCEGLLAEYQQAQMMQQ